MHACIFTYCPRNADLEIRLVIPNSSGWQYICLHHLYRMAHSFENVRFGKWEWRRIRSQKEEIAAMGREDITKSLGADFAQWWKEVFPYHDYSPRPLESSYL